MKAGKRPTRNQMNLIKYNGLNPENWLVSKNLLEEMHLVHRYTGKLKIILL